MENIHIQTTHNVTLQYAIASVGDRILAYLLDSIIIVSYVIVILIILSNTNGESQVTVYLLLSPLAFYNLLLEIFNNGQSVGKMKMNIRVMKINGTEATISNYLIRWMFRLLDITLFSGLIAIISILISNKGQRLGDMAAGTTVVKLGAVKEPYPSFIKKLPENYKLNYEQSSAISEKDIKIIANVLYQFRKDRSSNKNYELIFKAQIAAEKIMGIKVELHPELFLQKLLDDYNFIHKNELIEVQELLNKEFHND